MTACSALPPCAGSLTVVIVQCITLVLVVPLTGDILLAQLLPAILTLIPSTGLIAYGAAPIGVGLGLHLAFGLEVFISTARGFTPGLFVYPPVLWALGWRRNNAILFIIGGFSLSRPASS